ncbi:MAG: hypothetical protein IJ246_02000 [Clostridia bacterium]|nr:hypothetical protein [Clostridia bacterium]
MRKLMKYEFRKTLPIKLLLLGITAILQVLFLMGLLFNRDNLTGLSAVLLTITAIVGIMLIGIQSIVILHRDINTRQSYMLFMTPNSNYKILGSKYLENGLSLILGSAFFYLLGFLDIVLLMKHNGELDQLWRMFSQLLTSINQELTIDASSIGLALLLSISNWIQFVSTAYFADIVATALLTNHKHNGLLAFVLFVLISILFIYLQELLPHTIAIRSRMLLQSVLALILSFFMYLVSCRLMDRSLSV